MHRPPQLDPHRRTWHITFGTYATRLHSDPRPTVDRRHNTPGTPYPPPDSSRQQPPAAPPLLLTHAQCQHIEQVVPALCERGGWTFRSCAAPSSKPGRAGPASNHIHTLLDAPTARPPKAIRQRLKRWLTESLTQSFGPPPKRWWAEAGSTKPVRDPQYLINATNYINQQRTLPAPDPPHIGSKTES